MELTKRTIEIIEELFSSGECRSVQDLLLADCSNNLAGCDGWQSESLERVWLSILKLNSGNLDKLYSAISLAQTDYRDLFMSAGFGEDIYSHKKWAPKNANH